METRPGEEPIEDDEILYRRIPANPILNWYNPQTKALHSKAFNPREDDVSGISLSRAKHTSIENAAHGHAGKSYYIAKFRAGDLRKYGMQLNAAPLKDDPSHAQIGNLNYGNRKADEAKKFMTNLATGLCLCVKGPFESKPSRAL